MKKFFIFIFTMISMPLFAAILPSDNSNINKYLGFFNKSIDHSDVMLLEHSDKSFSYLFNRILPINKNVKHKDDFSILYELFLENGSSSKLKKVRASFKYDTYIYVEAIASIAVLTSNPVLTIDALGGMTKILNESRENKVLPKKIETVFDLDDTILTLEFFPRYNRAMITISAK